MRARAPFCAFLRASSPSVPSTTMASSGESSVLRVTVLIALLRKGVAEVRWLISGVFGPLGSQRVSGATLVQQLRRAARETATERANWRVARSGTGDGAF